MSKEIEMKMNLLEQLKEMLMGETGKRVKPKEYEPVEEKADDAEEKDEELEDTYDEEESDDDEDTPKRKKTLREFLESLKE